MAATGGTVVSSTMGQFARNTLGVLLACSTLLAPAPSLAAKPAKAVQFSFEVRVRDSRIGGGKLLIGPRSGEGRKANRLLQLTGQTEALLGAIYQGVLLAHSWVDGSWLPQVARWDSELAGRKSFTQALLAGGRLIAQFERQGRGTIPQDRMVTGILIDPVSFVPWLMQQKPKAGQTWTTVMFTGPDVCQFDISAKAVESVTVFGKALDALRLEAVFSKCRMQRSVTIWLATRDHSPQRLVLHDRLLGDILFDLEAVEQVPLPEVPSAPKEPLVSRLGSQP